MKLFYYEICNQPLLNLMTFAYFKICKIVELEQIHNFIFSMQRNYGSMECCLNSFENCTNIFVFIFNRSTN